MTKQIKTRPNTGVLRVIGKTTVNGVKALKVVLLKLNGVDVRPTKLLLTDNIRKRNDKLYAPNGVYQVVA